MLENQKSMANGKGKKFEWKLTQKFEFHKYEKSDKNLLGQFCQENFHKTNLSNLL